MTDAMSLEHLPSRQTKQQRAGGALAVLPGDDEVLTFHQWCDLNKISARNGRRILKGPNGPIITQLSARRIGITRRANRIWQQSRERR
jgi:hypothetical protein